MNKISKKIIAGTLLMVSVLLSVTQAQKPGGISAQKYAAQWAKVDSLASIGQPRSALEITDQIYRQAAADKLEPQRIKAVIYRIRLNAGFQENSLEMAISDLRREIAVAQAPSKQILQSVLGEVYHRYFRANEYRFRDRTRVAEALPDSIATWDAGAVYRIALRTYLQSLEDPAMLKKIPVGQFSDILESNAFGDNPPKDALAAAARFQPTLYDFLAQRALDFLMEAEPAGPLPARRFMIDQAWFMEPTPEFIRNRMMLPADSMAPASFAMTLFRNLAAFHFQDTDRAALIQSELKRLAFVRNKAIIPGKDSLYAQTLRRFRTAEAASPWSSLISYDLASMLNSEGQKYSPLQSEKYKWNMKEALEECDRAILRHPGSEGAKNCAILKKEIMLPVLRLTAESAIPAEKPAPALIGWKNIRDLYFRIVTADEDDFRDKSASLSQEEMIKYLTSLKMVRSWKVTLPGDGDLQVHTTEIKIPEVPAGFYVLIGSNQLTFSGKDQVFVHTAIRATQISLVSRNMEDGRMDHFVLNRTTGQPLANAKIEAWTKNYDYRQRTYNPVKLSDYVADETGYFSLPAAEDHGRNSNIYLKISYKNDHFTTGNFYQPPVYRQPDRTWIQTLFYTDRAIYRPGQEIRFKGIVLERTGDLSRIRPRHSTKVTFTDVNGQKIGEQQLTSNEFGSFSGSFTAPADRLPGLMNISCETGSVQVSVESYRLPTFSVAIDALEGNYRLGEEIKVKGRAMAYAGAAISGATVNYRVVRTARFPWYEGFYYRPFPTSPETEIASGVATTDSSGAFTIPFTAWPDYSIERENKPVFDFMIETGVTDLNGETQSVRQMASVGYLSMVIGAAISERIELKRDTAILLTATNLNGRPTPVSVSATIHRLKQPDRVLKSRTWERPDLNLMTRDEFHSAFPYDVYGNEDDPLFWPKDQIALEKTYNTLNDTLMGLRRAEFSPGTYLLTLLATDPFGEPVEIKKVFTVFSSVSTEPPENRLGWFAALKTECEPGEKAVFLAGSKEDNVNLMVEVTHFDSLVSREWIRLSDQVKTVEIPVTERLRGNFAVNFVFVKYNRVLQYSNLVTVPHAGRKLDVKFETFRDRLTPGSEESWRIRILGPDKQPAMAEFLAGMYDASLDLFRENRWDFGMYPRLSGLNPWDAGNAFGQVQGVVRTPFLKTGSYYLPPSLQLNWFGYADDFGRPVYMRTAKGGREQVMAMDMTPSAESSKNEPSTQPAIVSPPEASAANIEQATGIRKAPPAPVVQLRRDFRETAFFYPHLVTDSAGELSIRFTVPGSLTRWRFLGLAYTKNLQYAMVEKELISRKALMVFPNAPRFVRQGDTVVFSTKIVNLSDGEISGNVTLELSDAISLQSFNHLAEGAGSPLRMQRFAIRKGGSTAVSWQLVIPSGGELSVLQYKISAISGQFSDGEEKAIPVLTNRALVTESLPLPVRGKGTKQFTLNKLVMTGQQQSESSTRSNYRLTLEFSENPVWYAIQALPALNEKQYETADAIFAAWWSNRVASFIANSDPRIRAVFESWKNLTPDALKSNLEKNEELKSALLQATPWVLDAKDETARKQKLGSWFDQNRINENLRGNLLRLQQMQTPGGGWTWMPGMPENRYMTQHIVTGFGKLQQLGMTSLADDPTVGSMIRRAIGYLDRKLGEDLETIRKYDTAWKQNNHLGSLQIQYLYARSFFTDDKDLRPAKPEAISYFRDQAKRFWMQQERYMQGMIALALHRMGDTETPLMIMKSLSERALHSEEMGMYWAAGQGYLWYQAPVETQSMMIEAFDEVLKDTRAVDDMNVWLLKQKQTQAWKTSHATLEAIYALLLRGMSQPLAADRDPKSRVTISVGNEKIAAGTRPELQKEAGTGYFRTSWTGSEIRPEMGKVSVTRQGEGVAWGALYWQYFEDLDRITPAATPLKLEKKVYREYNTPAGPELKEISSSGMNRKSAIKAEPLSVGDKLVVRIVLAVDRDMEFVHMKDLRAAALEPVHTAGATAGRDAGSALLGYRYQDGLGYYQSLSDVSADFFFDYLPKGTWVFEYPLKVNAAGEYSNGITTIQCLYAPEFSAHSEGIRIRVK